MPYFIYTLIGGATCALLLYAAWQGLAYLAKKTGDSKLKALGITALVALFFGSL